MRATSLITIAIHGTLMTLMALIIQILAKHTVLYITRSHKNYCSYQSSSSLVFFFTNYTFNIILPKWHRASAKAPSIIHFSNIY